MKLLCPALGAGNVIPVRYARRQIPGGKNVSLPLRWDDVPPETKSFALTIIDVHPIANRWVHWAVANIPADLKELSEGASGNSSLLPTGCLELRNTFGDFGYGGPQPPRGSGQHEYVITLSALRVAELVLRPGRSLEDLRQATGDHVLASATVTGVFAQ